MNIIWLTPEMPFPANTGGRIGMYKRLEYFSKHNNIYLYSVSDKHSEEIFKNDLLKICKEVKLYCREGMRWQQLIGLYKGPFVCVSRWFPQMKKDILKCYNDIAIDYVVVDFPQMLGNLPSTIIDSGKVVLNQHNIEFVTLRNISHLFESRLKRIAGLVEAWRLRRIEERYYKKNFIKLYTFVSTEDKLFFEKYYGKNNTFLVPVGTEINVKEKVVNDGQFNICYIGKMEYPANAEAAIWFTNNVLLKLQKTIPHVKFYIVGKNPIQSVVELSQYHNNVIVTGTVEDIEQYYSLADIIVIPLFHGGGVKVKLLEALGRGKIVVTTRKGVEGTVFKDRRELVVANETNEFIKICNDIYNNPHEYEKIKKMGLDRIKKEFTWESIVNSFQEKLLSIL